MRKWQTLLVVMVGALMLFSAAAVLAQGTATPPPPVFRDGRLNAFDTAAPVVIFYTHTTIPTTGWNQFRQIDTGIELYHVAGRAPDIGDRILYMTADELNRAVQEGIMDFETTMPGYELHVGSDGWMWVSGPDVAPNRTYTYSWDDSGRLLRGLG
jgi:hypothetical protein